VRVWQAFFAAVLFLLPSIAGAETIEITGDWGGFLFAYQIKWTKLAEQKPNVRIAGPCVSACTVLLGHIPRENICATPGGSLGFHLATMQFATEDLWKTYPQDIRDWITKHGGLTYQVMWLQAPEIYHFIHQCVDEDRSQSSLRLARKTTVYRSGPN
jgi:hypothetical protein